MEAFVSFLAEHASHAHWFILLGLLLAGCNIPVSIDVLVIISAVLSVHFVPENTYLLYTILIVGCSLSAWIAFFLGRTLGHRLKNWRLFRPLLSEKRITKMEGFYKKYGALAFIIGRFIPFGIRNCLFMTSGLSKMSFLRFALLDLLACSIWVTVFFTLCYHLGQSFETLWTQVKMLNLFIFLAFSIAVISVIWYKRAKKPGTKKSRIP
jgi:membrane-associated protein